MAKLKEVCTFYSGTGFPKKYQGNDEGEYAFYKVGDIANNVQLGNTYLSVCNNYISGEVAKEIKGCILPKDTVVFAKIGEAVKLNRRAITSADCLIDNNAMGLAPIQDKLRLDYFFYYMRNLKMEKLAESTTVPSVRKSLLEELEIKVPSLEKQKEIGKILDKVSVVIQTRKQEIEQLDLLIKARFVELFGDVQHEEKYKGIPLGELCTMMSGGTPSTKFEEYYEGDIPWISTVSLGPNHIDGSTAKGYITQEAVDNSATKLIPAGNILFGTRVGVGKSSINDVNICTNQDIIAIIDIDESRFKRLFVKHVLDAYQPYYDSIKKGATILGITSEDLKDTLIPDAPIEVQMEYVAFAEQVDKSKFLSNHSLFLL